MTKINGGDIVLVKSTGETATIDYADYEDDSYEDEYGYKHERDDLIAFDPSLSFEKGDTIVCEITNCMLSLTKGKEYTVSSHCFGDDITENQVKIFNDNGDLKSYISARFSKKENKTNKGVNDNMKNTTAGSVAPMKTTKGKRGLSDKFGFMGKVDGVAYTMNGKLAFLHGDSYYSYEDGAMVDNENYVLEGIPAYAFPKAKKDLVEGDLILQKNGDYVFVGKDNTLINHEGVVSTTTETKHVLFGSAVGFVSVVNNMMAGMDTGSGEKNEGMFGGMNPMMLMMMSGDGDNSIAKAMMMSQMASGGGQFNPMMLMMMDDSKDDMLPMMMMMSQLNNTTSK